MKIICPYCFKKVKNDHNCSINNISSKLFIEILNKIKFNIDYNFIFGGIDIQIEIINLIIKEIEEYYKDKHLITYKDKNEVFFLVNSWDIDINKFLDNNINSLKNNTPIIFAYKNKIIPLYLIDLKNNYSWDNISENIPFIQNSKNIFIMTEKKDIFRILGSLINININKNSRIYIKENIDEIGQFKNQFNIEKFKNLQDILNVLKNL